MVDFCLSMIYDFDIDWLAGFSYLYAECCISESRWEAPANPSVYTISTIHVLLAVLGIGSIQEMWIIISTDVDGCVYILYLLRIRVVPFPENELVLVYSLCKAPY